ncbi:uncharacterized protein [Spinacia oleracea]|uniref:Replication protein A 70 kDa DNA-binding subunit B/D first OB fold domain-containing protein n=1 Tax=Spinacia oleracea TaxID=3562 RepID=A0ABM3QNX3_SPIOL|nr:uncharacterized protein LOC130461137 [Spinacia oleracea]
MKACVFQLNVFFHYYMNLLTYVNYAGVHKMEPTKYYVSDLDASRKKWKIIARLTRLWEVRYDSKNVEPDTLDMILLDEQDNHIQAAVPKNLITHFKDRLHEWRIFTFKHFNVTKTKRKLKPVSNEYMIWFTSFTSITPEEENIAQIAIHKFEIKPLEHLQERSGRNDIVTDVIGLLTGVENTVTDGE